MTDDRAFQRALDARASPSEPFLLARPDDAGRQEIAQDSGRSLVEELLGDDDQRHLTRERTWVSIWKRSGAH